MPPGFSLGQSGAIYSITVSNAANAGVASGPVVVSEIIPTGLTLESMSGTGWSCSSTALVRAVTLCAQGRVIHC